MWPQKLPMTAMHSKLAKTRVLLISRCLSLSLSLLPVLSHHHSCLPCPCAEECLFFSMYVLYVRFYMSQNVIVNKVSKSEFVFSYSYSSSSCNNS